MQSSLDLHQPERVAIVGSRDWPYPQLVTEYVNRLPVGALVISGGARGADTAAEEAAKAREDLPAPMVHKAAWRRCDGSVDRGAGHKRNATIVVACDRLAAFWWRESPGTGHSVELAQEAGKPVEIWYAERAGIQAWSIKPDTAEFYMEPREWGFQFFRRWDGFWYPVDLNPTEGKAHG
jgi:hypothetical protein